ncbi:hypothetical protein D3C83_90850 [compost metagenome]
MACGVGFAGNLVAEVLQALRVFRLGAGSSGAQNGGFLEDAFGTGAAFVDDLEDGIEHQPLQSEPEDEERNDLDDKRDIGRKCDHSNS